MRSLIFMQATTIYSKLEATVKSQEKLYKKSLKQHPAKLFRQDLFGSRRYEMQCLNRSSRSQPQPSTR